MRVAMVTRRNARGGTGQYPAYGAWDEAEDILIDGVETDLIYLTRPIETPPVRLRRSLGRFARKVAGPDTALPSIPSPISPTRRLSGRYDVAVFMAYSIWDLPLIEALGSLRRWADSVVVWFIETWPSAYVDGRVALEPFHAVDHVFVGMDVAVEPLSQALGREVVYLPIATDAIRFGPESPDAARPVDLIGLGRRREDQHTSMLQWAEDHHRLYLYDTAQLESPRDLPRHRDTIGRWYSQSKLATCNYAKIGEEQITGGHKVMAGRLWEGLASGAGLVGLPPNEISQRDLFGHTVVEPVPEDPGDLPDFLEEQIARHGPAEISANVRTALLGHDWGHRWESMFEHLGLGVPPGLRDRLDGLSRRAKLFE